VSTLVECLADYAHGLSYARLPPEVIHQAKRCVLDLTGCALGACGLGAGRAIVEYVLGLNGCPQATIWGYGGKSPIAQVALVNGTVAHHLELDDGQLASNLHAGITTIPAALAVAELTGATGRELITATVAGYEVAGAIGRMVVSGEGRHKLHGPGLMGALGAATAAGKLLGLSAAELANAISLAGSLLPISPYEAALRGATVKDLYGGWPNLLGVMAAELARRGMGGPRTLVEGTRGIGQCLLDRPFATAEGEAVLAELGTRYEILHTYFKPYASCRAPHPALSVLEELQREHAIIADEIESVKVETYPYAVALSQESDDDSEISARWDIPYNVAALLLWGAVGPEHFDATHRDDARLRALMARVRVRVGEEFANPVVRGARVVVRMHDGRCLESSCQIARWDEADPPSDHELEDKFKALTARCLPEARIQSLMELIWTLEECQNAGGLARALVCPRHVTGG